jgi:hypothetical protein
MAVFNADFSDVTAVLRLRFVNARFFCDLICGMRAPPFNDLMHYNKEPEPLQDW